MSPAEQVATRLAEYLGPNTARAAVRTFAQGTLGKPPEDVLPGDVPQLLDALRPMLRTLLGPAICEDIIGPLAKEFP